MTIDNTTGRFGGRIYVAWTDFSSGSAILVSSSVDHGHSWSTPVNVSQNSGNTGAGTYADPVLGKTQKLPSPPGPFVQDAIPAVGPDGTLYVVFLSVNGTGQDGSPGWIGFAKSTDGGSHFTVASDIADISSIIWNEQVGQLYVYSYPTIAVDPSSGNIVVAYTQNDNGDYNIYYRCSTNGGTSWNGPTIATQNSSSLQFSPWLCANLSGTVSLNYYQGSTSSVDDYVAESYTSGLSFYGSDIRITSSSLNPTIGNLGSEYTGIASTIGRNVLPVWTTTSTTDENISTALYNSATRLAYNNTSFSTSATSYNNNHTLERGSDGKLHEIFVSGGEIFYRRSSNNGSSWDVTTSLSSGNGSNDVPSIVHGYGSSTDNLVAVWQRSLGNYQYQIWYSYSTNCGASWSTPSIANGCSTVTVCSYQTSGPTPVVASFFYGGQEGTASYIVVFAAQEGFHYRTANSTTSGWIVPSSDIVPGSQGIYDSQEGIWTCTNWYPCLVSYNSQGYQVNLIYDDRFNHVYSQRWNPGGSGSWDNSRVVADWTGSDNRFSSLAIDASNNCYGVWSGYNSGSGIYTLRFRQGNATNNTWSSWYREWNVGENAFYPCITYYYYSGHTNPSRLDVLAWGSGNHIWQVKNLGLIDDNWGTPTQLATNSCAPNLTHETQSSGTPVEAYVNLAQSPYLIQSGAWGLPNGSAPSVHLPDASASSVYQMDRAAEIFNTLDHSTLRVEMSEPRLATLSGDTIYLPFKSYDYSKPLSLCSANVFDYLQTDSVIIPSDAMTLTFSATVTVDVPDTLAGGKLNASTASAFNGVTLGLNSVVGTLSVPLSAKQSFSGSVTSHHLKLSSPVTVSLQALRGQTTSFVPNASILGKFSECDLAFSLVNAVVPALTSSGGATPTSSSAPLLPENVLLGQNYPNPFNPTTTIAYRVLNGGYVSLTVYDVLGREVSALVNEDQFAGVHTATFDGSNLPSGIYFCRLTAPGISQVKKMILVK